MRASKLFLAALVIALPLAGSAQEKAAEAKVTVTPYGFVLLNAFFNQGTFAPTKDYPGAVAADDIGGAFLMSARQSRFGVRLAVDEKNWTGAALSGVIEFDFKGGQLAGTAGASTNFYNGLMRLRLAQATATWKTGFGSFSLLAGQDYGLVNPLFAESLAWVADPLFWQAGNLWRRSPQIRATLGTKAGDVGINVAVAALSPADAQTGGPYGIDFGAGNASGVPDLEARVALSAKFGDVGGTLGAGYHMEKRKYGLTTTSSAAAVNETTSLFGVDLDLAVTKFLQVKGEWYTGSGSEDTYNTGFGSAFVPATGLTDHTGWWGQAIVKPSPIVNITAGYGMGSVDDAVVTAAGARQENTQLAFGLLFNAGKFWRFGAEFISVKTTDGAGNKDDATQLALSSQFRF